MKCEHEGHVDNEGNECAHTHTMPAHDSLCNLIKLCDTQYFSQRACGEIVHSTGEPDMIRSNIW